MSHSKRRKKAKALMKVEAKPRDHSMSLHHRRCQANGGVTNARNTIMLPIKIHQAWHTITQSHSPEWIAEYINDHLIDPDYEFVCIKRE